jgi:hypothetical protein
MDPGKQPPMLHARISSISEQEAAAFADASACWPKALASQFTQIAKECIAPDVSKRPTSKDIVRRLTELVTEADTKNIDAGRECLMCMDALRQARLRPCCHVVFCEACTKTALNSNLACPICRHQIKQYDVGNFNSTFMPAPDMSESTLMPAIQASILPQELTAMLS